MLTGFRFLVGTTLARRPSIDRSATLSPALTCRRISMHRVDTKPTPATDRDAQQRDFAPWWVLGSPGISPEV